MKINEVYDNIEKWAYDIEQITYLINIKGKEYIQNYKLRDLQNISKLIKKCERCDKYFIPNPNLKHWQKYCDIKCRNQATRDNSYKIKLDTRQRPIDLLRKTIYERKYRARRDNIDIDLVSYNILLKKLTSLVKHRWSYTEAEFNNKFEDLQYEYITIVQRDRKGETIK